MKMHSTAFVSFLFALPCSAMATAKYCLTGINIEVGEKCFLEGQEYCGPNCTDIVCLRRHHSRFLPHLFSEKAQLY